MNLQGITWFAETFMLKIHLLKKNSHELTNLHNVPVADLLLIFISTSSY